MKPKPNQQACGQQQQDVTKKQQVEKINLYQEHQYNATQSSSCSCSSSSCFHTAFRGTSSCRACPPPPRQANGSSPSSSNKHSQQASPQHWNEKAAPTTNTNTDIDSGYAWIILLVIFTLNSSTFGTARTYGLIFEKLANQEDFSRTQAALPFTIMGAVENMAGPVTVYILARTQSWRFTVFVGSCLIMLGHILSGIFYTTLGQVLSLGVLGGLGLSLVSISSFQVNNAYFVRYRSTAFGIGLTGATLGTFYISPLCQHILSLYGVRICYLVMGLMLAPNAPLSLLLKPIEPNRGPMTVSSVSELIKCKPPKTTKTDNNSIWRDIIRVIHNPIFHLIWLTQLLFCWFNFVYSMILVDFGKDRGLDDAQVAGLIPVWALGQLAGRLLLGLLTDLNLISYRASTVLCFTCIGTATWFLNCPHCPELEGLLVAALVFILSAFISNLYILFNGLIMRYMEESHAAHSIGISSFIGSFFLLHRANVIGHYRDTFGNYDKMLSLFTYVAFAAAAMWLVAPSLIAKLQESCRKRQARASSGIKHHLPDTPAVFANAFCHPNPLKAPQDVFFCV